MDFARYCREQLWEKIAKQKFNKAFDELTFWEKGEVDFNALMQIVVAMHQVSSEEKEVKMTVSDNESLRELAKVTNPLLRRQYGHVLPRLKEAIDAEVKRGIEKWGETDKSPEILLNAALEELGEAAHAVNHDEGKEKAQQEIVETMGVLVRLYWMIEDNEQ